MLLLGPGKKSGISENKLYIIGFSITGIVILGIIIVVAANSYVQSGITKKVNFNTSITPRQPTPGSMTITAKPSPDDLSPTASPSATPVPATNTPSPTVTVTPAPTNTPTPSPTITPTETVTPAP